MPGVLEQANERRDAAFDAPGLAVVEQEAVADAGLEEALGLGAFVGLEGPRLVGAQQRRGRQPLARRQAEGTVPVVDESNGAEPRRRNDQLSSFL